MNEIKIFISCLKQYNIIIGNVSFVVKRIPKSSRNYTLNPLGRALFPVILVSAQENKFRFFFFYRLNFKA